MVRLTHHPHFKIFVLAVLLAVLYFSMTVIITTLIGVGIAVLLSPALDFIAKKTKLRRGFGAVIILIALLILFLGVMSFFGWIVVEQVNALLTSLPDLIEKIRGRFSEFSREVPWLARYTEDINIGAKVEQMAGAAFAWLQSGIGALTGVVFSIILGLYLAVDGNYYFKGAVRAFPPEKRKKAADLLTDSAKVVRVWFRAQLIDMILIGLITTLGLWIVDVPYWAAFGFLTALLGIIPYVGVMIVVVIVCLITAITDMSLVPYVLLVFFITQQIEGNLILPLVMKDQAEIPEALLIVVMLFFGSWFGLIGIFIAPPLLAVGILLYRRLYLQKIEGTESSGS